MKKTIAFPSQRAWFIAILIPLLSVGSIVNAQPNDGLDRKQVSDLMQQAAIPGLQLGLASPGEPAHLEVFGYADSEKNIAVTQDTLFEAASLSKPVMAYITLRLVQEGRLELDTPLWSLLPESRFANQAFAQQLTPRLVLSHQSGLPNWGGTPLEFNQAPGSGFGYSGEGYVYLQRSVEALTGKSLAELANAYVFSPLGMQHSVFTWPEERAINRAKGHDEGGGQANSRRVPEANAASSLHTTVGDYLRFVREWTNPQFLAKDLIAEALKPQVDIEMASKKGQTLSWGLGWGMLSDASGTRYWHWGDNGIFRAFVAFDPASEQTLVYLSNSQNGLAIAAQLLAPVFDGFDEVLAHLEYGQSDQPAWQARQRGNVAEQNGDFAAAIQHFSTVLEIHPDNESLATRITWLKEWQATPKGLPLNDQQRKALPGKYGPRQLRFEDGQLVYQREGNQAYPLKQMAPNLFALHGLIWFRLEVQMDEQGKASKLIGHYIGGGSDESLRSPSK